MGSKPYVRGNGEKKMIIAVDFDGVIVEDKFPDIGEPNRFIIERLKELRAHGDQLILWTCRDGERLKAAVEFCVNSLDLHFDAINENLDEIKIIWGNDTRKVYADAYWDDKAVKVYNAF